MEKILFKRPCIYKGRLFEQISVSYPNRYTNWYSVGGFVDGIYTFYMTDRFPRDTKKCIMDKLLQKFEQ